MSDTDIDIKVCIVCLEEKPITEFSKRKDTPSGYRNSCKVCYTKQRKEYYDRMQERILQLKKDYYLENKESIRLKQKEYYASNSHTICSSKATYRVANKEKLVLYRSTPDAKALSHNAGIRRRGYISNTPKEVRATSKDISLLLSTNSRCYYCKGVLTSENTSIDHYIPLVKGGQHTIENLRVCCATCNSRKGSKEPEDFMTSLSTALVMEI